MNFYSYPLCDNRMPVIYLGCLGFIFYGTYVLFFVFSHNHYLNIVFLINIAIPAIFFHFWRHLCIKILGCSSGERLKRQSLAQILVFILPIFDDQELLLIKFPWGLIIFTQFEFILTSDLIHFLNLRLVRICFPFFSIVPE